MSLKKTYSKDKKTCTVTFTVKANETHGAEKITLAGDFTAGAAQIHHSQREKTVLSL